MHDSGNDTFENWVDEFNSVNNQLTKLRANGEVDFETYILILNSIGHFLKTKNPSYIERLIIIADENNISMPAMVSSYQLKALKLRYIGDKSSYKKALTAEQFDMAFNYMARFKAVGATVRESSIFAAICVATSLKDHTLPIKASSIEKKYSREFKCIKTPFSGKTREEMIFEIVTGDEKLKDYWLNSLNKLRDQFDLNNLPYWIEGNVRS
ncbi:hypothetical protein [Pseudoalteromonas sp. SR43-2]|uniref:hypothetical protein n=1 Tax=Pseudoalteromonas sp. SR43-2 TaxID=2760944 RepID=UPI0015FD9472|nr:hypothetical protein [Pseudoalteromonas sp. SR43-2]MBB1377776.1 hypothetical protein [Pseudoalteromonas sp. SR43-2]